LFLRSAKTFKEIIEFKSNGRIQIEILTKSEFFNNQKYINSGSFYKSLKNDNFQMAQFQTTAIGTKYKNFHIFDLPFLFKDHEHASRVLDGSIGKNLLDLLGKNIGIQGLAFTYSGGFRIMVSNQPIKTLNDIKDKTLSCSESPITKQMYQLLGANVILDEDGDDLSVHFNRNLDINFDGGETTLVRFDKVKNKTPFITNTKHSLFLTTIVINNQFWDTLSNEDKLLFKTTAKKTALIERNETIEDSKNFEENSAEKCNGMFEFSEQEMKKFKELTSTIYSSEITKELFTPALVKKILVA